jgi:hypothetical protein
MRRYAAPVHRAFFLPCPRAGRFPSAAGADAVIRRAALFAGSLLALVAGMLAERAGLAP